MHIGLVIFVMFTMLIVSAFIVVVLERPRLSLGVLLVILLLSVFVVISYATSKDFHYESRQIVEVQTITANGETFQEIVYRDNEYNEDQGTLRSINLTRLKKEVYPAGTKAAVELSGTSSNLGIVFVNHLNVVVPYKENK